MGQDIRESGDQGTKGKNNEGLIKMNKMGRIIGTRSMCVSLFKAIFNERISGIVAQKKLVHVSTPDRVSFGVSFDLNYSFDNIESAFLKAKKLKSGNEINKIVNYIFRNAKVDDRWIRNCFVWYDNEHGDPDSYEEGEYSITCNFDKAMQMGVNKFFPQRVHRTIID